MSIYDRDYYRRDPGPIRFGMPGRELGLSVTAWLIIINASLFLVSFVITGGRDRLVGQWFEHTFWLWPDAVFGRFMLWQLLTSAFLHGGIWHLVFNMFVLWMFGKGLEAMYGKADFLIFYLQSGIAASASFAVSQLVRGDMSPALGASGCVFGVLALYAIHYPRQKIFVWGILPVEVWQLALVLVGLDFFMAFQQGTGVAHIAHLGGAAWGLAYFLLDPRIKRLGALLKNRSRSFSTGGFFVRMPAPPQNPGPDFVTRARVDALLDKISRDGLASLTDEERDFLKDASGKYK